MIVRFKSIIEFYGDFFAKVMSDKRLCKPLLESILNIKIRDIKYVDYEETIQMTVKSKGIRLDIYVEDENNTVFNLEMQTTEYEELPKRSRYYQEVIDLNMIEKGESYGILKESYVIFICTFDFFGKNKCIYEFENLCIDDCGIKLKDGTHKIFLNTKGDKKGINKELKSLLEYFDGKEPESDLTKQIDEKVIAVRKNTRWRREYMSLQMEMNLKYREGLKAGEAKGQENINKLNTILLAEKRYDDLEKSAKDIEYQNKLMKEYKIIE